MMNFMFPEAILGCELTIILEMNSQYNMPKVNITKEEDLKELVCSYYFTVVSTSIIFVELV